MRVNLNRELPRHFDAVSRTLQRGRVKRASQSQLAWWRLNARTMFCHVADDFVLLAPDDVPPVSESLGSAVDA